MPLATRDRLAALAAEWGERLVTGWHDWIDAPRRAGDVLAGLLGARPGEVIVCDSTTVNLYKLCAAALDARGHGALVTDRDNFPTDRYVLEGLAAQRGLRALRRSSTAPRRAAPDALIVLSHVGYRSGALADMRGVTDAARAARLDDDLGPLPLGRRRAGRPARRGRRAGRRLHLQVPQRRAGRARVPLRRRGAPGAAALADLGLVRPARPVRHGARLRPGRRASSASSPARRRSSRSRRSRRARA